MKVRQGFVTNSSSTSYVIAKKKGIPWGDVLDWPEAVYINNHAKIATNEQSLRDCLFDRYGFDCEIYGKEIIDLCIDHYDGRLIYDQAKEALSYIDNDYEIAYFSIDRDYAYEMDYYFSTKNENVTLIEKEDS